MAKKRKRPRPHPPAPAPGSAPATESAEGSTSAAGQAGAGASEAAAGQAGGGASEAAAGHASAGASKAAAGHARKAGQANAEVSKAAAGHASRESAAPSSSGRARAGTSKPAGRSTAAARAKLPEARATKGVAREPVFWFGFEVSWAKVAIFRVVFFGMLAVDALLQIRHAPRYGANDFNVAQLPLLDGLGAGRVAYGVSQLVIAYALVMVALGVGTRWLLPIAAVLYAWLYFGSQLDAYQHHYLMALVLALACFVPWQRPDAGKLVRSWALRLILVQLGIMYLWAAISKLDPAWVDGATLGNQISGALRTMIEKTVGFQFASIAVIGTELTLAGSVWL
jgi:hypothetical protein